MLATSNFLIPNGTLVVVLVIFLVVLGVLWAFVLPPVNKVMDDRQRTVADGARHAEEGRALMEQTAAERRRIVDEARAQAREKVDAATRSAEGQRAELLERTQLEHDALLAQASADAAQAVDQASGDLRQGQGAFASEVAAKVLGAPLRRTMGGPTGPSGGGR